MNPNRKAQKTSEIERLVQIRLDSPTGEIRRNEYEAALIALGQEPTSGSIGALRRSVAELCPAPPLASTDFEFTDDLLARISYERTLKQAYENHIATDYPNLSYSAFFRQWHKLRPALRNTMKPGTGGRKEYAKYAPVGLWAPKHINMLWAIDITYPATKVIPPGSGRNPRPVPVAEINILGLGSRAALSDDVVYCTPGRAVRGEDVCAAVVGAMDRYGVPDALTLDNGKEFDNALLERLALHVGIAVHMNGRYNKELNGKVERFHRTMEDLRAATPTDTDGVESASRYPLRGNSQLVAPTAALHEARRTENIRTYNNRTHSMLGVSPFEFIASDPIEIRRIELHKVLHFGPIVGTPRKPQRHGVNFNGAMYQNLDHTSPGRGNYSGAESYARALEGKHPVSVRPVSGDKTRIGLYDHKDRFICIATRSDHVTDEQRMDNHTRQRQDLYEGERLTAEGQAQLEKASLEAGCVRIDNLDTLPPEEILVTVATIAHTDPANVTRRSEDTTLNDKKVPIKPIVITTLIGDAAALDILQVMLANEDQPLYRIQDPEYIYTRDPSKNTVRKVWTITGEAVEIPL